jgi:hypothetical protein
MVNDVRIDRFSLDIPGVSEAGLRRIALMVVDGLSAAGGLPQAVAAPRLNVSVPSGVSRDERELARLIVAATLRDLNRTS